MTYVGKNPKFDSTILKREAGTPANPAAGSDKIVNRAGILYMRNSAGTETQVGTPAEATPDVLGAVKTFHPDAKNSVRKISAVSPVGFLASAVNTGTNEITAAGHGLLDGDMVQMTTTGTLPSPLATSTNYYAIVVDDNTFKLASSVANVESDTEIVLTTQGTGTHTATHLGFSVLTLDKYKLYLVTTSATNFDAFITASSSNEGRRISIKKDDSGSARLLINRTGSDTIEGDVDLTLYLENDVVTLEADGGTSWEIINQKIDYPILRQSLSGSDFNEDTGLTITGRLQMQRIGNSLEVKVAIYTNGTGTDTGAFALVLPQYQGVDFTVASADYAEGRGQFNAAAGDFRSDAIFARGNGSNKTLTFSRESSITTNLLGNQFGAGLTSRFYGFNGSYLLEIDDWRS